MAIYMYIKDALKNITNGIIGGFTMNLENHFYGAKIFQNLHQKSSVESPASHLKHV